MLRQILGCLATFTLSAGCGKGTTPAPATPNTPADAAPAPTDAAPAPADAAPAPTDAAPAPAEAAPAPTDAAPTDAAWAQLAGEVSLPGGLKLHVIVRRADDALTLDIPDQNLLGAALSDIVDDGQALNFAFSPPGAPPSARAVFTTRRNASGTYEGQLTQNGMSFPAAFRPTAAGEPTFRERPQTPQPPFPYPTSELSVQVEGGALACTLALPTGATPETPAPGLIMRTGSGTQDRDETLFGHKPFLLIADTLARVGVASLRCDDRGAGGSVAGQDSDDLYLYERDARQMLAALASQPAIDATRVGILGHSEGALTAAVLLSSEAAPVESTRGPVRPAFGVLLAGPGHSARELVVRQNRDQTLEQGATEAQADAVAQALDKLFLAVNEDEATQRALAQAAAEVLLAINPGLPEARDALVARFLDTNQRPWMRSFIASDSRPHLAKAQVPVLALFGERDRQVPPDNAEALRAAASETVEVVMITDANHLFQTTSTGAIPEYQTLSETMKPEVLERLSAWLTRTTGLVKTDGME